MVKKRFTAAFLIVFALGFALSSCSSGSASPTDLLYSALSGLEGCPDSDIYFSGASELSENYASEKKLSKLYAGMSPEGLYSAYALSLARGDGVYELHVFKAGSEIKAIRLEKLMRRRVDMLQSGEIYLYNEENYESVICRGEVIRKGAYVILLLTDDNEGALKNILDGI